MDIIDVTPDINRYFEQIVQDAFETRGVEATGAAEHYLVKLLSDYARGQQPEAALDRPLTFQLHDALEARGMERFHRLQGIGDAVLYVVGFFGANVTRRGADKGYLISLGSSAYGHASAMLRMGGSEEGHDVLEELSEGFGRFVIVVREIADNVLNTVTDDRSVLQLYERWERHGSERLAEMLGSLGLCPVRGGGEIH